MNCSITEMGLEMPPDQKESQILSTWDLRAPVIIVFSVASSMDNRVSQVEQMSIGQRIGVRLVKLELCRSQKAKEAFSNPAAASGTTSTLGSSMGRSLPLVPALSGGATLLSSDRFY